MEQSSSNGTSFESSQLESYTVNMSYGQYRSLFNSKELNMSRLCPSTIKEHNLISGEKGQTDSKERYEFTNGTFCEYQTNKNKCGSMKWKTYYKITSTNKPCLLGMG